MTTENEVEKPVEKKVDFTPEELALLENNRKLRLQVAECSKEIAEVLKKYNMHLDTSKPQIIVTMNRNA